MISVTSPNSRDKVEIGFLNRRSGVRFPPGLFTTYKSMSEMQVLEPTGRAGLVKAWIDGVQVDRKTREQLLQAASMPFVFRWLAAMPDCHLGKGATIGSVIPTRKAIIPAAVGVDLGCGMVAAQTNLNADQLPENLAQIRHAIERAVPHGRTNRGGPGDRGSWGNIPNAIRLAWHRTFHGRFHEVVDKHPKLGKGNTFNQLGTLGGGNHFIEICLDEDDHVWIMLHSGSRGVGNRIGTYFINRAKEEMERRHISTPNLDLAYLTEGSEHFEDYVEAVGWAQDFAFMSRQIMLARTLAALNDQITVKVQIEGTEVNCHHNYVERERHYDEDVWVTRKGALRARAGDMGIIPGSMGAKSFIVRGKGNPESFHSCSHGAGRIMSRTQARKRITLEDHERATAGVECRRDSAVLDESPAAYKDIDRVMAAQTDLVEPVHTLHQIVCIKG